MAALGDELAAAALGYGRARLEELRAAAPADLVVFAAAAGVPPIEDAGGVVAGHLADARSSLDAAGPALAGRDLIGTARHLGTALHHVDLALTAVGASGAMTATASPGTRCRRVRR